MPVQGLNQLKETVRKLKTLQAETQKAMVKQVETDSVALADINRDYLEAGEKPDGKQIQPRGYSPGYASFKEQFATYKNTSWVDLKFDGHFHESIRVDHKASENFTIKAELNKPYFKDLFQRYGQLVGIRQKDMDNYVSTKLIPKLEKEINRILS